ncbi:MAG TPA: hypothetical protein VIM12_12530 [Noviherbaspirillum sp.]|jgi:uncharacterized membrane protein|uniref:CopD family protein n=1 Tax=Noviherbaspirillum sp. TaxID=1926288 RepID=UPI002F92D608
MIYLLLKAVHVAAMTTFVGGLTMLAISVRTSNLVLQRHVGRWNRRVTAPALLFAWMSGIVIATQGRWFGDAWLTGKLVLVAGLTLSHAVLSGIMKHRERGAGDAPPAVSWAMSGSATIAATGLIALLAVIKPH